MADDILTDIDTLVAEEQQIRARAVGEGLSPEEEARLQRLEQQLDQCWDLLRQRRARTEFHQDPKRSTTRPVHEVESYEQ